MGNEIARLKFSQYLFIYELHYKRWYSYIRIGHKTLMEAVSSFILKFRLFFDFMIWTNKEWMSW